MENQTSKIHPELQQLAQKTPRFTVNPLNLRLINLLLSLMPAPKPPVDVRVENVFISSPDGQAKIRLRLYQPSAGDKPTPVLIWLHGGGYVLGKPEMDDLSCIGYVRELGLTVVSVDYRYAPKYRFPIALEDSYAALKWVVERAQELKVDAQQIAVGGASAGGGLAAALAQYACDRQEVKLIFQLLVYPMLDDRTVLRNDIDDSDNVTWNHKNNRFGWEAYLGKLGGAAEVPAYAVPARRADLAGLPPAWIGVGSLDIFHDEDVAYGQRLRASGVECEMYIAPQAFHGFDVFDHQIPVVRAFRDSQMAALKKYLR